jgi:ribonuclease HII
MLAGVDEAGRGPVLGPLVVAAVLVESDSLLRELGVKDSKQLSPAKREAMAPRIREVARRVEVRVIEPAELNRRMPKENLNEIEVAAFAELLTRLEPAEAVVDACDVDAGRFGRNVASRMKTPAPCVVRAEHGADANHPVVAAASVVAKVERDRLMALLSEEHAKHGGCGSGYASDPATRAFLEKWMAGHKRLPPCARKHWETARRYVQANRTLLEF